MIFLVPGGAGYIGSHMVKYLQEAGHEAVVLDDFSTGHEWAVKDSEIMRLSLLDQEALSRALKGRKFDCVIHFAGKSLVDESIKRSNAYYRSNVVGSLNLINELMLNDNNNMVFSSSAAIFGNPITDKINEDFKKMLISKIPSGSLGSGEDVSNCVAFLSSDMSKYINGETS